MFDITKKQIEWCGTTLTLETGKIARQASAAVVATMGDTVVLAAVVGAKEAATDAGFFPLTVNYLEKFYAAGRIPGGFFKRESKPSERETLISRLIDRPIRPLFPEGFYNDVQVTITVLSYDGINDPDIVAMIAASAALTMSDIPFAEAIACARVGYKDGEFFLKQSAGVESSLELIVAGTKDSILMVESEAKELPSNVMLEAVMFGHKSFQPVIKMINAFAKDCKKPKMAFTNNVNKDLIKKVSKLVEADIATAYLEPKKTLRSALVFAAQSKAVLELVSEEVSAKAVKNAFDLLCQKIVRTRVLKDHKRIDGRNLEDIRQISCELDVVPRVHGSALFTRGETQALVMTTIGTAQDEQTIDDLMGNKSENLMLHYNFPPYSVGETGAMRAPGRREIGHGKLALKAITAVVPSKVEFPYTMRVVSEITESNGSSSMATVCGSSLSMMAAGIPMKRPVAGIAMGLIKEEDEFAVLSDIMGDEDHLGDMDFKVAGTSKGVTALQMDIKIGGISKEIMEIALNQAVKGLVHIAGEMAKAIENARSETSQYAPRVVSMQIDKDKIREVIGSGGKVIREICEKSGAKVDIEDTGKINVAGTTPESIEIALQMIKTIVAVPEIGKIYEGVVTKLTTFGAFVKFLGATEGLLHISEVANERIEEIEDVLKEGQAVTVQVIGMEGNGKVRLSMKSLINGSFERNDGPPKRSGSGDRRGGGERSGGSRFGGGDRGGSRFGSGGGDRGGSRFGGSSGSRGGDSRGGDRGGERSDRGDRGGERSSGSRGGDSRGGDRGNRSGGGERSDYRGERSDRGGERSGGGDRRPERSADSRPRFGSGGGREDGNRDEAQKRRRFF